MYRHTEVFHVKNTASHILYCTECLADCYNQKRLSDSKCTKSVWQPGLHGLRQGNLGRRPDIFVIAEFKAATRKQTGKGR